MDFRRVLNPVTLRVMIDRVFFDSADPKKTEEMAKETLKNTLPDFLDAVIIILQNMLRLARYPETEELAGVLSTRAIAALNLVNQEVQEMHIKILAGKANAVDITTEEYEHLRAELVRVKERQKTWAFNSFVDDLDLSGIEDE